MTCYFALCYPSAAAFSRAENMPKQLRWPMALYEDPQDGCVGHHPLLAIRSTLSELMAAALAPHLSRLLPWHTLRPACAVV